MFGLSNLISIGLGTIAGLANTEAKIGLSVVGIDLQQISFKQLVRRVLAYKEMTLCFGSNGHLSVKDLTIGDGAEVGAGAGG